MWRVNRAPWRTSRLTTTLTNAKPSVVPFTSYCIDEDEWDWFARAKPAPPSGIYVRLPARELPKPRLVVLRSPHRTVLPARRVTAIYCVNRDGTGAWLPVASLP